MIIKKLINSYLFFFTKVDFCCKRRIKTPNLSRSLVSTGL